MICLRAVDDWCAAYILERLVGAIQAGFSILSGADGHNETILSGFALRDGGFLDVADPAVKHLVDFAASVWGGPVYSIDDLLRTMTYAVLASRNEMPKGDTDHLRAIFALKSAGGWVELDRLIRTTRHQKSLCELVDPMFDAIRTDPKDDFQKGEACYSLGCCVSGFNPENVVFGSRPDFVVGLLDAVLEFAGAACARDTMARSMLIMSRGRKTVFRVPLQARSLIKGDISSPQGGSVFKFDYRSVEAHWPGLQWEVQDLKVMRALSAVLSGQNSAIIKARYLECDLGM